MSANASWNARTSGWVSRMNSARMPSSSACVISWAITSLDNATKTIPSGSTYSELVG